MILCVTLNPCLDKTLSVGHWRPGDSVRGHAVTQLVGGKGNNVTRALRRLGRTAQPALFLGGATGELCARLLREREELSPWVIATAAETRIILTVRGPLTGPGSGMSAFFDPDPAITAEEAAALTARVESLLAMGDVEAVTLSGSSPAASTHGVFAELIALARTRRVPVFLDTYGPAMDAVWGFWPDVLQMNRREAALHLGVPENDLTEDRLWELLGTWASHGVFLGLITRGPDAVLAQAGTRRWRITPPEVTVVNPIGSGDSLLAGLTDAWLAGCEPLAMLRRGIACAVANAMVWDAGAIDPGAVTTIEADVAAEELAPHVFISARPNVRKPRRSRA